MKEVIFVSGNQGKADQLAQWLGLPIEHQKVEVDEIQSLDLRTISEHKARQAYERLRRPVLVEDVGFTLAALGQLPGPFIRWFLEEHGNEGLCRLVDKLGDRRAAVTICYALYDGKQVQCFESHMHGQVPPRPRGEAFGWNPIFIPQGSKKTYAEMTDEEVRPFSIRAQAIEKLRAYLQRH